MNSCDNTLVVASFKDVKGDIIKSMSIDKNTSFNIGMIPEVATSYYLYSKKKDGKYSNDASCQIGLPLEMVAIKDENNKKALDFFKNAMNRCAYLVLDNKQYVIPLEDDIKLVNNYAKFVKEFKNDLENIQKCDTISKCK